VLCATAAVHMTPIKAPAESKNGPIFLTEFPCLRFTGLPISRKVNRLERLSRFTARGAAIRSSFSSLPLAF
jgi:hypothetical protein